LLKLGFNFVRHDLGHRHCENTFVYCKQQDNPVVAVGTIL
jgi:hypothetical protein